MSSVSGLLNQLKLQRENEDHVQVYETAAKILETSFDVAVLKTCLVALINLDNYELALKTLQKHATDGSQLVLEKAYIYYKANRADLLTELLSVSDAVSDAASDAAGADRGLSHLKAQFHYQQGNNTEALKIYKELIKSSDPDELLDLSVNERAAISQSLLLNENISVADLAAVSQDDASSYDLLFNNALIQLNKGNTDAALASLQQARAKCEEVTASYTAAEKFAELFPILLQTSYTHFKSGNVDQSEQILNQLLQEINITGTDNKLTTLLVLNNLYAIRLSSSKINPNIIYSNLKFPQVLKQVNLILPQRQKLESNHAVLSLAIGKTNSALLALIAEVDFDRDDKTIAKRLFRLALNHTSTELSLLAIQYNNATGNYDNAYTLINRLASPELLAQIPSLIAVQIFIYEQLNKSIVEISENFAKGVDNFDLSKSTNYSIFKEIVFKLLSVKQDQLAADVAQKLYAVDASDKLIGSIVHGDTAGLAPIEDLIADVDVEALLSKGVEEERNVKSGRRTANRVTKAKYKRHKKVPEHLAGKTVDPERWLPLKDRSYYKPKKGKKSGATQGGAADATTEINIASTPVAPQSAKPKAAKKKNNKKRR